MGDHESSLAACTRFWVDTREDSKCMFMTQFMPERRYPMQEYLYPPRVRRHHRLEKCFKFDLLPENKESCRYQKPCIELLQPQEFV